MILRSWILLEGEKYTGDILKAGEKEGSVHGYEIESTVSSPHGKHFTF